MTTDATDSVRIDWHRHDADEQAIVSVDAGDVRMTLAFPADSARSDLDPVLVALDRELEHYCATDHDGG